MNDFIILVDENDKAWGKLEKMEAHQLGLLHRAFSVFIFNKKGELLIQQRAAQKYHSAGLWTNTCCSHPMFGEEIPNAVNRRLLQEMGMSCATDFMFSFIYKAEFENGMIEHEFDHVYFGLSDSLPVPAETEVQNWKYISLQNLASDIEVNPGAYTEWMKICLPRVQEHFKTFAASRFKVTNDTALIHNK